MQKEIKIFLASSEELMTDRDAFGDLIRQLDNQLERQGLRIRLYRWEDLHLSHNGARTQDRYNEIIKECDLFVSLFYTKAGAFTLEEVAVAGELLNARGVPEMDFYFKNRNSLDIESKELEKFRKQLEENVKYFWNSYDNGAALKLSASAKLQKRFSDILPDIKSYNSKIYIGSVPIANFDELPFAANNKKLQGLKRSKAEKLEQIEQLSTAIEINPKLGGLRDQLKQEVFDITQDIDQQEEMLLATSVSIIDMQGIKSGQRLQDASAAFDSGDLDKALEILNIDNIIADADKVVTEMCKGQNVIRSMIEELLANAKYVMSDTSNPERIENACKAYSAAVKYAEIGLRPADEYILLLLKYAQFCFEIFLYHKAIELYHIALECSERILGEEHSAKIRNSLGQVYFLIGDYSKASAYIESAISINENLLGSSVTQLSSSYINLGNVYYHTERFDDALYLYNKVIGLQGDNTSSQVYITATCFIARIKRDIGDGITALEYLHKALCVSEKINGKDHPDTAVIYGHVGEVFYIIGDNDKAIAYMVKAMAVCENILGKYHNSTIAIYNNIGEVYNSMGDYDNALKWYNSAIFGETPSTAKALCNIGMVYSTIGDYSRALEFLTKALNIYESVLGEQHPDTAVSYNNIGYVYYSQGKYSEAHKYYNKALEICEQVLGSEHPYSKQLQIRISELETRLNIIG